MTDCLKLENRHTGEILRVRRVRDSEGQWVILLDGSLPPGKDGPPRHIHFVETESGRVTSGTLGARVGDKEIVVPAGGSALFPAGTTHAWWNAGQDLLEFNGEASPAADLDRYLQAVFAVVNAGEPGRPSLFHMAHVAWRHRDTQALTVVPPFLQRLILPVILLVGHLLGKYRGDHWPGCPASCPGAPEMDAADAPRSPEQLRNTAKAR